MSIQCKEIINYFEELAPLHLAEEWDNSGLQVGSFRQEIKRILVCLDVTTVVVEEAIEKKVDMIISHHPLLFKGMKRIIEEDTKGSILHKLIQNGISVYSAHTNLDVADDGLNDHLAELLGLRHVGPLNPYRTEKLFKIVVFVPQNHVDAVRNAMAETGAGWIGNYSECSFMTPGVGTFKPLEDTNPFIGVRGQLEKVNEYRLETIVPEDRLKQVVHAMIEAHPYEEAAYDIYEVKRQGRIIGLGKVGQLERPASLEDFLKHVKERLNLRQLHLIGMTDKPVNKVAVFSGSFDGNFMGLIREGVDVLVTGDIKHHTAVDLVENGLCVIDAGHFATEVIVVQYLTAKLNERFPEIDIAASTAEKNPIVFT